MFALRALAALASLASRIVCLIVIAWFVVFAVGQSKAAATRQVNELGGGAQQAASQQAGAQADGKRPAKKRSAVTRVIDEVAETVTSPFSALTSGTSSAWLAHGADTLLALLIYGLGVGFLARLVRLRV